MNPDQKELFRKAILSVLDTNRTRFGLGIVPIAFQMARLGFSARDFGGNHEQFHEAIKDELEYLTSHGFIEEAKKQMSAENRAWRITAQGIAIVDSGA
jgi:hypothetical protein